MAHFIDRRLNGKNKSAVNRQRFIRRYKKQNDEYRSQSKFAISSRDQAKKIIAALTQWVDLTE